MFSPLTAKQSNIRKYSSMGVEGALLEHTELRHPILFLPRNKHALVHDKASSAPASFLV